MAATAAEDADPLAPPPFQADPFTAPFQDPNIMERLADIPEVRQHMADPGFVEQINTLRKLATGPKANSGDMHQMQEVSQTIAKTGHNDPRIMQALMALQGHGLIVDEKDLKKAESVGDIKRREPIQLEHLQLVHGLTDPDDAKAKGNEYFKKGDFNSALAHYDKGIELLRAKDEAPAIPMATLLSNAAMCLLKLKWPDRAKKAASTAIAVLREVGDETFDQSKLFHRRAMASEQMREFGLAADDMARAFAQAKKAGRSLKEQHDLKNEVGRLKKLKASQDADIEKKGKEKEGERTAEVTRMQGKEMEASSKPKIEIASKAVPASAHSGDYLADQDFTFWTRKKLEQAVKGIVHKTKLGGKIEVLELQEDSKLQAQIMTKRGKRSLFYEMDLNCKWRANVKDGEMMGLIRLYNVGHDTKFQLGGDENTSYMYQLAWDQRVTGNWKEDLRVEAAELFDLVAAKVDEVIAELRKK